MTTDLDVRCLHDLPRVACIWCTPRPGAEEFVDRLDAYDRRGRRAGWHQATTYSRCAACGETIQPGDTFRWADGPGKLCEGCGDA